MTVEWTMMPSTSVIPPFRLLKFGDWIQTTSR